jgi:hypothetical protein
MNQKMRSVLLTLLTLAVSVHSFSPSTSTALYSSTATYTRKNTVLSLSRFGGDKNIKDDVFVEAPEKVQVCSRRLMMSRIVGGCAAGLFSVALVDNANAEVAAKVSVSSQAKVAVEAKSQPAPAPSKALPPTDKGVPKDNSKLENPGDIKNCSNFDNYKEAKTWFDKYYDLYGDIAKLDKNNNLIPCESLPGAPPVKK